MDCATGVIAGLRGSSMCGYLGMDYSLQLATLRSLRGKQFSHEQIRIGFNVGDRLLCWGRCILLGHVGFYQFKTTTAAVNVAIPFSEV